MTWNRSVVAMCAAQACAQIGAFGVAALIPTLLTEWSLSHTEAGWISGIYYAAYTLVVPLLSSLTDRVDPKRIYLGSVALTALAFAGFAWVATGFWSALVFRALMGVGWAGSYMPGLKALSDLAEGPQQSRAVAAHAAAVGVSGALSFGVAGAVNAWLGWQLGAGAGRARRGAGVRPRAGGPAGSPAKRRRAGPRRALLDFRPVLRNRSALAYSIAYCVHTWEMSALRGWVVAFLTFRGRTGGGAWTPMAPATVASVMGLLGVWASVWGNELAIRFGRRRFILGTMLALGARWRPSIGFSAALPYAGAALLVLGLRDADLVGFLVTDRWQRRERRARTARRDAGGPLDPRLRRRVSRPSRARGDARSLGGASVVGWGLAFGHVTVVLLAGALVFVWLRPADLAGDRGATPRPVAGTATRA